MRKILLFTLLSFSLQSQAQSVFGYWYGDANVKSSSSSNNYLVELILQPEGASVKGVLNYYFRDTYRSLQVKGNYNSAKRELSLYDIPVVYHASRANMEVDCIMNMKATLKVAQAGSDLTGSFIGLPDYRNMCPEISFNLRFNADISKKDSVMKAIAEFKENYQVWKPSATDTLINYTVEERKVTNYVTEGEFTKRTKVVIQELEVESDTIRVDVYDNGEIDGDMVSLFYNNKLILNNQKLTHKSIQMKLGVDQQIEYNEIAMFAENLGLIPPNTALMVVIDGKNRYEVRVSSNMEKNATIRIKKKKKP